MSESCNWNQEAEDCDAWESDCGGMFSLNEGTPLENKMRWCCFCGKPLTESPYEDESCDDARESQDGKD